MVQITSIDEPFRDPRRCHAAIVAVTRAEAMGLLPEREVIRLDRDTFKSFLREVSKAARILTGFFPNMVDADPEKLDKLLHDLNQALEESPVPEREWPRLIDVLGVEPLARLLGISASSIRRYKEQSRETPGQIAARLHFLALIVGDLAGTYNNIGVRAWFDRVRKSLGDKSPAQVLIGSWKPEEEGPRRVRELSRSLLTAGAT